MATDNAPTIVHNGQSGVQIGVVSEHGFHDIIMETIVFKQCCVRFEENICAVFVLRFLCIVAFQLSFLECQLTYLTVAEALYLEVCAECVDGFHTNAIETDALFERL